MLRVRDAGLSIVQVDEPAIDYRLRGGSLSRTDKAASRAALPRMLHESLKRNRKLAE